MCWPFLVPSRCLRPFHPALGSVRVLARGFLVVLVTALLWPPDRVTQEVSILAHSSLVAGTVWWLEEEATVTLSPQPGTREPWTLVLTQLSPLHAVEHLSPKNGAARISRGFSHLPWLSLDTLSQTCAEIWSRQADTPQKAWYWPSGFQRIILAGEDRGGRQETWELTSQLKGVCFVSAQIRVLYSYPLSRVYSLNLRWILLSWPSK